MWYKNNQKVIMANNVISAFNKFQTENVNLGSEQSSSARSSRDWLISQINNFPAFFPLYKSQHINFGSFARRTKIPLLNDIDIMIALISSGCTYVEDNGTIYITVPDNSAEFSRFRHDGSEFLNSRKVVNHFVSKLGDINQYSKAEIKRNQEAATLDLHTYDWVFDIVPCFFTTEDIYGKTYYIIPDGSGHWKKTDPRIDRQRVTSINTRLSGNVLNTIRVMKYWHSRPTMPQMGSYLLENIILNYYDSSTTCSEYVDIEIPKLLYHIAISIYGDVQDPKGIQGNINNLTYDQKKKISDKAVSDHQISIEAREAEGNDDHKKSIYKWRKIFGNDFPEYSS